ncbi:MAG: 5-formyltetrahydrofolate cyclo-ligase [Acidimicrobiia bacterium]
MDSIREAKRQLRERMRGVGRAAHSGAVVEHLAAWPPLHGRVVTYLAMGDEIDLGGLASLARCSFLAPRIDAGGELCIHELRSDQLRRHPFGFLEPGVDARAVDLDEVDVVLVPGRAFDSAGNRLGRGKGYYDRLLARLPRGVVLVGVTVEGAFVDEVPVDERDESVDWVVTESGIRRVGGELQDASDRFVSAAVAYGIAAAPVRFPQGTRTSRDAADAIGCELGAIAKTLVFVADGKPVLVICSGDRRVDEGKLASFVGATTASAARLSEVRDISGYAGGGTPAVGHSTEMPAVIDASLGRYRWVWSAAGTPESVYPVSLERLIAATGARVASVASEG